MDGTGGGRGCRGGRVGRHGGCGVGVADGVMTVACKGENCPESAWGGDGRRR